MSELPPTLSYSTPPRRPAFRLPGLVYFWVAGVISAISAIGFAIFGPVRAWDSSLGMGEEYEFLGAAFNVCLFFTLSVVFGMLPASASIVWWTAPRFEFRRSILYWIGMGVCYGLGCTLPRMVDILTSGRPFGMYRSREQGWGFVVVLFCYFGVPVVTLILSLRRRPVFQDITAAG
jgi:hypothetical protein